MNSRGEFANDIDASAREWIEERAAILEYDVGMPRAEAERLALEFWSDLTNAQSGQGRR